MTVETPASDPEFVAMHSVYKALEPLDDEARSRVVAYVVARLEITTAPQWGHESAPTVARPTDEGEIAREPNDAPKFSSFAELFDAAQPKTNPEKALVAGYWLQVCQGAESFDGFAANKELKNLGHGLVNITNAIEGLKMQKPALALQLAKSGAAQQARKTYKLTVAGIKMLDAMMTP